MLGEPGANPRQNLCKEQCWLSPTLQGLGLLLARLRLLTSCFWLFRELWLLPLQQQW